MKYKGWSIADLLEATVEEATPLMENLPQIQPKLETLLDVGLGYIHLGTVVDNFVGRRGTADQVSAGVEQAADGPNSVSTG